MRSGVRSPSAPPILSDTHPGLVSALSRSMNYELRPLTGISGPLSDGKEPSKSDPERLQLLLNFNNAIGSQLELDELLKSIFEAVKHVFTQTVISTLAIHNSETNELRVHLLESEDPELFHKGMALSLEGTPSGLAFKSRQTVLIYRLTLEDFGAEIIERVMEDGIKSACSVPLVSQSGVVGTLTVASSQEAAYSQADADLLSQVGLQIAVPIENALNFRAAQRERDLNRLLLDVNNAVASNLDIRELL